MSDDDDDDDGSFLADEDCWEGWWSVLACSLVVVETNSWCAPLTTLWTDKGLEWGLKGCCSLFLPPAFFLCSFMPLCLKLTTGFSHWWAPVVLVWGLLLPWLVADSRLCKLSLQLIFVTLSWSTTIALSFLELTEEDCFGHIWFFYCLWWATNSYFTRKQWHRWIKLSLSIVSVMLRSASYLTIIGNLLSLFFTMFSRHNILLTICYMLQHSVC